MQNQIVSFVHINPRRIWSECTVHDYQIMWYLHNRSPDRKPPNYVYEFGLCLDKRVSFRTSKS